MTINSNRDGFRSVVLGFQHQVPSDLASSSTPRGNANGLDMAFGILFVAGVPDPIDTQILAERLDRDVFVAPCFLVI